ncbi:MAG TPA: DUF952 domain-containing protein [Candidatus Limnocylindrales bacterium]|jgi:uncharacterized protein (DUF952 family)
MARLTLHLVPAAVWDAHDKATPYLPAAYPQDGFVHCTDGDAEMVAVANRFYAGDPRPFLLLTLDLERTGSPWRFDDPDQVYPHVYGPIDPASVVEVRRMVRDADGAFLAPEPLEGGR